MSSNAELTSATRAGPREWFGLAVLLLPVTLMTADLGVLWLATPYFSEDLRPSSSEVLWITDIYGFMTVAFLVVMGTLGDRIGRRRLLILGSLGVIIASVLAAYSVSPEMLIASRALLGVAGAAVLPSTLSLISHMFVDPGQRTRAIAMWVTALSVGIAIGPIVGGILLAAFWWGSVFLMAVPIMLLPIVVAPVLLPEYRDPNAGRLDLVSVVLFLLGILPIIFGIKRLAEDGPQLGVFLALAIGVLFSVVFVQKQRRLASPLLDMRLFSNRSFTAALLVLLFGMMALNGVEYLVPAFLLTIGGLDPFAAGLWLLPSALGLIVGSQLTPVLVRRLRPAYVIASGVAVALVGFWMCYEAGYGQNGVVLSSIGLTVVMFGVAPISVLGTTLAVSSSAPEKAGSAAATGQTAYDLGLAFGIAFTGSVAVAVYRRDVTDGLGPDVSPEATAAAVDSIGGAAAAAEGLPAEVGAQVMAVARDAFANGFHAASAMSAAIAVVTIGLVLTLLRHVPPTGAPAPDAAEPATEAAEPTAEPTPAGAGGRSPAADGVA